MNRAIKKLKSHWLKDHPENNITDFCYLDNEVEYDDFAQHDSGDDSLIEERDIKNKSDMKLEEGIDVRMWFHLNNKTKISILIPSGETDGATIMNCIGQGRFAAALASTLNIGCAVDGITRGIVSANIGELELNSLIFQDDIAIQEGEQETLDGCWS